MLETTWVVCAKVTVVLGVTVEVETSLDNWVAVLTTVTVPFMKTVLNCVWINVFETIEVTEVVRVLTLVSVIAWSVVVKFTIPMPMTTTRRAMIAAVATSPCFESAKSPSGLETPSRS